LSLLLLSVFRRVSQLWESSDNTLKQQILSDAQENNNKAIVTYDVETDQKEIIYSPSNSQSLIFVKYVVQIPSKHLTEMHDPCHF
jgi:hypothetical protein